MSVACKMDDSSPDRKIKIRREYSSDSLSHLIPQVVHMPPEFFVQLDELCKNPPPPSEYLKKAFREYLDALV